MFDSYHPTGTMLLLGLVIFILAQLAFAMLTGKLFKSHGDEAFISKGQCAECGSKQLRTDPVDDESFHAECRECGAMWLVFVDAMKPVERILRQRASFPSIKMVIDSDRPAIVFEAPLARASFPFEVFNDLPALGSASPRDLLRITHDEGINHLDMWLHSSLLLDHGSEAAFEPQTPEVVAEWRAIFFDYMGIALADPEVDPDYA